MVKKRRERERKKAKEGNNGLGIKKISSHQWKIIYNSFTSLGLNKIKPLSIMNK